jgi:hypothetical protein
MTRPNIYKLMEFENGELDEDEIIELFQDGIDNGWVWSLQGSYGRMATMLIEAGQCTPQQAQRN